MIWLSITIHIMCMSEHRAIYAHKWHHSVRCHWTNNVCVRCASQFSHTIRKLHWEQNLFNFCFYVLYYCVCVLAQASTTKLKSALHAFDSSIVTKANLLRAKTHSSRDGFLFTHFTLAHTDTTHIPTQVNVSLILCFFFMDGKYLNTGRNLFKPK